MKFATYYFLLIALASGAAAQETPHTKDKAAAQVQPSGQSAPWLGVSVSRLDDAVRAQVPDLPTGFGFVVSTVDAGSPAEQAGVKPYDVFWKLGDQWLANEAQLFSLIRLHQTGDEVKLGIYRSGQLLSLVAVLDAMPEDRLLGKIPQLTEAVRTRSFSDTPMKLVRPADRTAEIKQFFQSSMGRRK
jgi:predicted metalloprotease with PDZ domain